ncbi:ribonuclease HI [endosymbiont of Pachyrhynchus infernalis]|uniref:ribonuclease HI n=1 Tax=endosymbiont of Pachyrhynchus infernalis TaxID=1971488 RepID=UPI000DC71062|nr:ribonuclease HI [endosymbiont of Pachyrhynchus infernalis]BBA84895.1 ribonuclease H [endosymbiont of Pachyrhynchus infernalis]
MNIINVFTDGSCTNNPGPGGYGIIIKYNNNIFKFSSGYYFTTNNRMELIAVIKSLEILKNFKKININLDSLYVKNGITIWINNWIKNNWRSSKNKIIKNIDLWKKLYLLSNNYILNWNWIKSHSNCIENNICDKLAKDASINPKNHDLILNKYDKYI